jgi:RNA polymerase sigma-70 factor (ECF subfamily)
MSDSPPPGSTTLLIRLSRCPTDPDAWSLFVQRYGGTIYRWCCRYGLQDADARDVSQDVFAALLRRLHTFDRSRARFRSWLFIVVRNCVRDWCSDPAQHQERGTEAVRQRLNSEQARRDLEAHLNEEFDLERLQSAEMNVRLLVAPHCWDAYRLRCKERLSLREAARQIGIPAGHVSKYALRVRDLVARQIALLEGLLDSRAGCETEGQHEPLSTTTDVAEVCAGPAEPRTGPCPHGPRRAVPGL